MSAESWLVRYGIASTPEIASPDELAEFFRETFQLLEEIP